MAMRELLAAMREPPREAAPVRLVPAGRRQVRFSGQRGAEGPLTIGQANTLSWVRDPAAYARMVQWALDLPDGATLDDIAGAFSVLMERHESLRTTYPAGGEQIQRVARSGELAIDIYEVAAQPGDGAGLAGGGGGLAAALVERLRTAEFDLGRELPLRVAVAVSRGVPLAAAVVYSHMAADLGAMAALGFQFTQLAGDPASRAAVSPGPQPPGRRSLDSQRPDRQRLAHQPLDQAAAERSPRGRRMAQAALRNWEAQLRSMPQCLYAAPLAGRGDGEGPLSGWLWSPAAARALPHIAARTGVSRQAAVLAALCAVLSRRTGHDCCSLTTLVHNRYERRLRDYVGSLACDTIMSVDVRVPSFDQLARRAGMTTLRAGKGGLVDGVELARVVLEVEGDRGISYTRDCVYNDTSYVDSTPPSALADPADVARALGRSELQWVEPGEVGELLAVYLGQVEGEMVLGALTADRRRVPRADIESLLHGVELLLAAATCGDVDLGRVGEITGVRPVRRGPGWLRVDSCWIELAEVQRLVDDALAVPAARVFAEPDPAGEPRLVAYLTAGAEIRTPDQAHAACMAVLPAGRQPPDRMRYTAMAPGEYVICAGAPGDPADLTAWQRQPVLGRGAGRPSSRRAG